MMKKTFTWSIFLMVPLVFLSGCDEEQVLYSEKSPEPIEAPQPPAPQVTLGTPSADMPAAGQLPGLEITVPEDWVASTPSSSMRLFQYEIPGTDKIEAGEFIAFYFGPQGGGSVEDNLKRWAEQIQRPDAVPPLQYATLDTLEVNGLTLHRLYSEGMYSAMTSLNESPEVKNDWGLMGIVIEGGEKGPVYLKFTGPREMFEEQKEVIDGVLGSVGVQSSE